MGVIRNKSEREEHIEFSKNELRMSSVCLLPVYVSVSSFPNVMHTTDKRAAGGEGCVCVTNFLRLRYMRLHIPS